MRYWVRELAGWGLLLLGLYMFLAVFGSLMSPTPKILEAAPLTVVAFVVFRGGIHLLKVAMAARVCLHAQNELLRQQRAEKSAGRKDRPAKWDW